MCTVLPEYVPSTPAYFVPGMLIPSTLTETSMMKSEQLHPVPLIKHPLPLTRQGHHTFINIVVEVLRTCLWLDMEAIHVHHVHSILIS